VTRSGRASPRLADRIQIISPGTGRRLECAHGVATVPDRPGRSGVTAPERFARPEYNLAGAIYGQILSLAVVASLSEDSGISAGEMLGSVAATMLVFWIAHAYSEVIARRVQRSIPLTGRALLATISNEWPIAEAALPPMVGLLLGAIGLVSRDTAVAVALTLGVAALFAWGVAIGRGAQRSWPRTLAAAGISTIFGLVIIGLKIVVG
jgi:hypothetical protein